MVVISIIFLLYFGCCVYFYAEVTNYLNCTNKEVIFLFCNVILIVIGKESGLSWSSPQHHNDSTHVESFNQEAYELSSTSTEIKVEEERIDCDGVVGNAADSIGCLPIVVFEEKSKEMEVEAVEEEEKEVEILTKRIEEFIERNKKTRRQEALQLMVT